MGEWGYTSFVVPYKRTKDGFFGKISGIKEVISPLQNQTEKLSKQIEEFLRENPNKKIIMAGLSNGAIFVDETMGKVSDDIKNKVLAIEIGIPFWKKKVDSENILRLDNKGKDTLAEGKTKILLSSLFKAPFKWILARITGENLAFSKAFYVPGHEYSWTKVKPEVNSFLENKLK